MKIATIIITLFVSLMNNNSQNEVTAKAVYDGYFEGIYSFTIEGGDEFVEQTIEFDEVPNSVLKEYNLETDDYVNQHFSITYLMETEKMEDENGLEEEWTIFKLTSLKKL